VWVKQNVSIWKYRTVTLMFKTKEIENKSRIENINNYNHSFRDLNGVFSFCIDLTGKCVVLLGSFI